MARHSNRGPRGVGPTNVALPAISGTTTVGQTLTCSTGVWSGFPEPEVAGYQWIRGASTEIAGATNSTYTLVLADQTNTMKCRVTTSNYFGTTAATSASTAAVT